MVTWRQGGRDLTIELFTQQHTHTVCVTYLTHTFSLSQRKHDIIYLCAADGRFSLRRHVCSRQLLSDLHSFWRPISHDHQTESSSSPCDGSAARVGAAALREFDQLATSSLQTSPRDPATPTPTPTQGPFLGG
ncbi:hypothetical protein EYF80_063681 [Liparis tanakae]|uniref:Uncharacterized protein n=1 Tax=Liparis tanakae TaxID=230148 RepID=A0A4Z2ED15_9TELE|nr:hypothetical protein EYF80_063681 [Liparis tanakae]